MSTTGLTSTLVPHDLGPDDRVDELDVVGAVAAVEDGRLDLGVLGDAERVLGTLLALRAAATVVVAGGRATRNRERTHGCRRDRPAQERSPVKRAGDEWSSLHPH